MQDHPVDDWFPVDEEEHARQCAALIDLLDGRAARVLDLGAGDGRIAAPLRDAGHHVLAVDHDRRAVDLLRQRDLEARAVDFLDADADLRGPGPWDAILCLGNTFMTVARTADALALMRRLRGLIAPDGVFVIDALCEPLWREVAEGYWQNGVSEDGQWQMLWHPGDNVLSLRQGDAVDEEEWTIRDADVALRLWSRGELELLAAASGWRPPYRAADALLVFRPVTPAQ